jgi:hypothetical protein
MQGARSIRKRLFQWRFGPLQRHCGEIAHARNRVAVASFAVQKRRVRACKLFSVCVNSRLVGRYASRTQCILALHDLRNAWFMFFERIQKGLIAGLLTCSETAIGPRSRSFRRSEANHPAPPPAAAVRGDGHADTDFMRAAAVNVRRGCMFCGVAAANIRCFSL